MRRSATRHTQVSRLTALALAFAAGLLGGAHRASTGPAPQAREEWQRAADVMAAVGALPGARIADVGCGDGFYTVRLARAVGPEGRIYAVDVSPRALDRLRANLEREGVTNVEVIQGAGDDPRLPDGSLDGVLIVNAYHEMSAHQRMLGHIHDALKPAGRLVLLESVSRGQRHASRASQERRHQLAPSFAQDDLRRADFLVERLEDPFATRPRGGGIFWLILARPRAARGPGPRGRPAGPAAATPFAVP